MLTPQNGIFAQGTHAHYFLEFDLRTGVKTDQALTAFKRLRAPDISAGGVNFVLAFGPDFWRTLAPAYLPEHLSVFREIQGVHGKRAPATQHDAWVWINGSTPDVTFEHARAAWLKVREVAILAAGRAITIRTPYPA